MRKPKWKVGQTVYYLKQSKVSQTEPVVRYDILSTVIHTIVPGVNPKEMTKGLPKTGETIYFMLPSPQSTLMPIHSPFFTHKKDAITELERKYTKKIVKKQEAIDFLLERIEELK